MAWVALAVGAAFTPWDRRLLRVVDRGRERLLVDSALCERAHGHARATALTPRGKLRFITMER
eukprot:3586498-Prymnesium_polylepis.1